MLIKTIAQRVALLVVICLGLPLMVSAQNLQGVVRDTDNNPLIAVAIQVGEKGTITDADGKYELSGLKIGDQIEAFYIGMKSQTITYNGQTRINFIMEYDEMDLDEVIVVGFGKQSKETLVGSITQVDSKDILRSGNVTTIGEALTGLMPGVSTTQASGQPGATNQTILIRGQSTWTDNSPLCMVDGVERSFDDLDPNEIESISILKDASSTAVYGVKAANGVILVTTKTGEDSAPRVSFNMTMTVKDPTIDTDYISDYPETLLAYNQAAMNDGLYNNLHTDREIAMWSDPNRNMEQYTYTRWVNEILKTGYSQTYNVNVSGGNKKVKYFTSLGYNYDGDIIDVEEQQDYDPRTYQKRYNWRTNVDFQITKSTKFSVKLAGDVIDYNGNTATSGDGFSTKLIGQLYETVMTGTAPVLNNGSYGMQTNENLNSANILVELQGRGSYVRNSNKLYSDFILEQQICNGLVFNAKLSFNQNRSTSYTIAGIDQIPFMYPLDDGYQLVTPNVESSVPTISSEGIAAHNTSLYYEGSLQYNKTFNEVHNLSAMGIFTRRNYQTKSSGWYGMDWPTKEESWISRVTYGYDNKYLAEFNGAYNGSEKFAPGNRFGFFPSAAIGWVLSEENFIKEAIPAIEFMKIRYSYGLVGSDAAAPRFAYLSTYGSVNGDLYYGYPVSGIGSTYKEGTPANADATWETAIKQNLGLELTFLDGRLNTTFDLFDEKRKDIYMERRTIAAWYGGSNPMSNMGETKNHGFDLEVNWYDNIGDFSYWAKGNMSISENRVVFRDDPTSMDAYRQDAGKPIGYVEGLINTGMYQDWQDIYINAGSTYNPNNLTPGDLIHNDYNGDGQIDDKDMVPIENPTYAAKTYAFSFGASWKGFSLSAMFNGTFDVSRTLADSDLWCFNSISMLQFTMHNNDKMDAWTPYNTDASHPALHTQKINHNWENSTYTVANSSYLRLRNLEFKYTFGDSFKKRVKYLHHLEVYINGQNLFTWSPLPDVYDPESPQLAAYPISKKYSVGLRCTF
ncbi:MAG: TonB-dependent receptor [Rikenellaceae bacterium]